MVERLHSHQRVKEDKVEAALSFKQYQELKQCTFTPDITREVPQQQVRKQYKACLCRKPAKPFLTLASYGCHRRSLAHNLCCSTSTAVTHFRMK